MFEKILIKSGSHPSERFLPIADLVDMMFYYGEVHVLASQFELSQLLTVFSEDILYQLIEEKHLYLHPCDQHIGAGVFGNDIYSLDLYSRNFNSIDGLLYSFHKEVVKDAEDNKRFAESFSPLLDQFKYSKQVNQFIQGDLENDVELGQLTKSFILQYYPGYSEVEKIEIHAEPVRSELNGLYRIESNLNLEELNKLHQINSYPGNFDIATILMAIGETAADCSVTAEMGADLMPTLRWEGMYRQRINDVINRTKDNVSNIDNFHKTEAISFLSPGAAFVQGRLSSKQLLKNLNKCKTKKFRKWLSSLPNDAYLASSINEAVRNSWGQKWPVKTGRVLFQIMAGIAGTLAAPSTPIVGILAGAGATVLDGYAGDRITQGWNPRMFVDTVLREKKLEMNND